MTLVVEDGLPDVMVSFGSSSYEVSEGGSVQVSMQLSVDPEREVKIPLVVRHVGGATAADYSGVPPSVTFSSGVTEREFEFGTTDDSEEDYGESVVFSFGPLPSRVSGRGEASVSILDDDTPPRAAFEVDGLACEDDLCRVLTGESVRFADTSTGPVESLWWDFGDGVQSRLRTPDHGWVEAGFYEVTLRASDGVRESTAARMFLVEASEPAGTCESGVETLCLQDSRYAVSVDWWNAEGQAGEGSVVHAGTNDSGLFWFFGSVNWEVLVKVLDGCALNGHVWVYAASPTDLGYSIRVTDTVTGVVKDYRNEPGLPAPAVTDDTAFAGGCADDVVSLSASGLSQRGGEPGPSVVLPAAGGGGSTGGCVDGASSLCLQDGRYEVRVRWSTLDGKEDLAKAVGPRTSDSGLFYFYDPGNWEMLVKVLDGCAFNGHHWVYAASATDLGLDLEVRDTVTGEVHRYRKDPGEPAPAVVASGAFSRSCQP